MVSFPDQPFAPARFSPKGGGIDFLGMRWVNLRILGEFLLPGFNNQTSDLGVYFLATWIPWKFRQLCRNKEDFKSSGYKRFREAVEVAISHTIRDGSPSGEAVGYPKNRIGVQQSVSLPGVLSFGEASRRKGTSLYAPALYGPSLHFLNFLAGAAAAEDGRSTGVMLAQAGSETETIARYVDSRLSASTGYGWLSQLTPGTIDEVDLDDLGSHGLNPACYRLPPDSVAEAAGRKMFSDKGDLHWRLRRDTAKLLIETLLQEGPCNLDTVRRIWITGLSSSGQGIVLQNPEVDLARRRWGVFLQRQHQRYFTELLLTEFEMGVKAGCPSIAEIVKNSLNGWVERAGISHELTFEMLVSEQLERAAEMRGSPVDERNWCLMVGPNDSLYEFPERQDESTMEYAMVNMARWWLAHHRFKEHTDLNFLVNLGGADRIGMSWFHSWLSDRKNMEISLLLKEMFSKLIFVQHLRIAVSRFDGQTQRLRFFLGDEGIVPSGSAEDLGQRQPRLMDDRLYAFASLLTDLGILSEASVGDFDVGCRFELLDRL